MVSVIGGAAFLAGSAMANGVSVQVYASVAPDPSSAQYSTYLGDALYALPHNLSSSGTYTQTSLVTTAQTIGTGFDCSASAIASSCMSSAGSIVLLGTAVNAGTSQFSLNDVTFTMTNFFGTSDAPDNLGATLGGFGDRVWGYDATTNTWYDAANPGNSSTLVNSIYFAGFGDQFYVANESDLGAALAQINGAPNKGIEGTYDVNVGGTIFSGSGMASAIPEPGTYALCGLGIILVGSLARRRKSNRQ
jgi:hypothetical protein